MPEMTQHNGLKKPLASESADISVINDNMDMIDSALGDLSSVPTAAKDAAGAITELHEAVQEIDVDIPDGSITPTKLSFDPATQTELDAHINATNVHGATNAPAASRLIIRDANGRAKVAAPAASDDIALLSSITKAQAGLGSVDNFGTATQPEAEAGTATNKFMTPQRTKQAIDKYTGSIPLRLNNGQLEYNAGGVWQPVGAGDSVYKNLKKQTVGNTTYSALTTVLNITGKRGYINYAMFQRNYDSNSTVTGAFRVKVTADGVVVYDLTNPATNQYGNDLLGFTSQAFLTSYGYIGSGGGTVSPGVLSEGGGSVNGFKDFPRIATVSSGFSSELSILPGNLYFDNSLTIEVSSGSNRTVAYTLYYATN